MATAVVEKGRLAAGKAPRDDKLEAIEALQTRFHETTSLVLFDYRGLSVAQMTALRRQTREAGVRLSVVKNSLTERAVEGTDFEELRGRLVGPISIVTTTATPRRRRRYSKTSSRESPPARSRAASGRQIPGNRRGGVARGLALARSAALDVAIRIAGPCRGSARVLNGVISQLINVVDAIAKKKE